MQILLIEDHDPTARGVELMLKAEGISLHRAATGEDGADMALHGDYDVVLLDLVLPGISGRETLRRMRRGGCRASVMALTGLADMDNRVSILDAGADDYLVKPYERRELVARIQALARRARGHADAQVRVGDLAVNMSSASVEGPDGSIHLTGKEFQVLQLLCMRRGMIVSREMFMDHLYGGGDEPEPKIVDVLICKVRKKIAAKCRGARYIRNVWGQGYVLEEEAPPREAA